MTTKGRPTKYDDTTERTLLEALRSGNTRKDACALAGIHEGTFERWLHRFADFADRIKRAEAEAAAERVERIGLAGLGGAVVKRTDVTRQLRDGTIQRTVTEEYSRPEWTADAWLLERRYPDAWGRRDRMVIDREKIIEDTRRKAREQGVDEDAAVAEVERLLNEARGSTSSAGNRERNRRRKHRSADS